MLPPSYILISAFLLAGITSVGAEPTDLLYDPEPPADSAYVRIVHAGRDSAVDVLVDGKPRIHSLAANDASDYMVLPMGKHTLTLQPADNSSAQVSANLNVDSGHAITVAFTSLRADSKPQIFEDKANSNKLKAVLAVYHLSPKTGALDIFSADGKIKVFGNVAPGSSSQLSVNPISIELIATQPGNKTALAHTTVAMSPGGTYSILLLPGADGKLVARAVQNKVERYTGK